MAPTCFLRVIGKCYAKFKNVVFKIANLHIIVGEPLSTTIATHSIRFVHTHMPRRFNIKANLKGFLGIRRLPFPRAQQRIVKAYPAYEFMNAFDISFAQRSVKRLPFIFFFNLSANYLNFVEFPTALKKF